MDNYQINQYLTNGDILTKGVLPHVDNLKEEPFIFEQDFGLSILPKEPGVIFIRGPRQYGKSTWLEQQIAKTIQEFGAGSALYLNGDEIKDEAALKEEILLLIQLFSPKAAQKRLFIDEITAIQNWQKAIKRLLDANSLKDILLVTTGSKATDLRRGVERLPGRKGKLLKTNFIFTPLPYREFKKQCEKTFQEDTLWAYILSGGSAVGANALAKEGHLPEYVMSLINDWILGEFAAAGRSRAYLLAVLQSLFKMAGTPLGQAKLARESGLSNNTLAQSYIELLSDLMVVLPSFPYDFDKKITLFRKPCKYHFINLLATIAWHPKKPRTLAELKIFANHDLGMLLEWVVSQEIWRRMCYTHQEDLPLLLHFWQSKTHEVDFVLPEEKRYIEVKAGNCNPLEFTWFLKQFKQARLTVISKSTFETERITGVTLEDFLQNE